MSTTCYVRIWIPNDPNENWGHYDLYVNGSVSICGQSISNPVFSYYSDSKLYIFPVSRTKNNYPVSKWHGYTAWTYSFSASSTAIKKLGTSLTSVIQNTSYNASTQLLTCTLLPDNKFSHYSRSEINSFAAVATWCSWLGSNTLLKIYNEAHDEAYTKYLPAALNANTSISSQWKEAELNGD